MATEIFVQRDGIVNHKHDGVKGWHNPATSHKEDLHSANDAARPTNLSTLNAGQKAQYKRALAGESFYGLYNVAVKARREEAGEAWAYGRRAAAVAPAPEAPILDGSAPVPAGFDYEG